MTEQQSGTGVTSPEAVLERIMERNAEIQKIRRKQSAVSIAGVLLILVFLLFFVLNLKNFGEKFDQAELQKQLLKQSAELVKDREVVLLQQDMQEIFLPALQSEFQKQLKERLPDLKADIKAENERLLNHIKVDTRNQVTEHIRKSFEEMEKRLIAKHGKEAGVTAEELEKALKVLEQQLVVDMTDVLDAHLADAGQSLSQLNHSVEQFKELPEYKSLENEKQSMIESQLLETLLELWIYNINPARGEKPYPGAAGGI
ncbi:MAG: hypothetical protein IKB22_06495 [Lentisphaeria bacterium]|nr:hypothetical protein [Lentisphaeria bacterium]